MISFVDAQCSVKVRIACSKALLLTISSSNIVTYSLRKCMTELMKSINTSITNRNKEV